MYKILYLPAGKYIPKISATKEYAYSIIGAFIEHMNLAYSVFDPEGIVSRDCMLEEFEIVEIPG